jgi:hypothetical protein
MTDRVRGISINIVQRMQEPDVRMMFDGEEGV